MQNILLHRDQLARQHAPLVGQPRHLVEDDAIGANHVQADGSDRDDYRQNEPVDAPLDPVVDPLHRHRGLLLALVVEHQQPRYGGRERRLLRFERGPDQRPRLGFLPRAGQPEHPVGRIPELQQSDGELLLLIRPPPRDPRLDVERVLQVHANATKLQLPGIERIRLGPLRHVAHGERQHMEVVLDAQ